MLPLCASAYGSGPAVPDIARFAILPGWQTAQGTRMTALRVELAKGWKTYWRVPGETGIPPGFDWTGSRNLQSVRFHWPVPQVFDQNGIRSIGYTDELVLPMELVPSGSGPILLRGTLEIGVCRDICLPIAVRLSADLDRAGEPDARIAAALANRPVSAHEAGVGQVSCRAEPIADGIRVQAIIHMHPVARDEVAVFEIPDPTVWIGEARTRRQGDALIAVAEMVSASAAPFLLNRSELRITVLGGSNAVAIKGCTTR